MLGKLQGHLVAEIHAGAIRNIVKKDRPRRIVGESGEVAIEPLLRGPGVMRTGDEIAGDRPCGRAGEFGDTLPGVAVGKPEIDWDLLSRPRDLAGGDRDQSLAFVFIERQPLAGCCGEHESVDGFGGIVLHQAAQRLLVQLAVTKRRDQRQPQAAWHGMIGLHDVRLLTAPETGINKQKTPSKPAGS